MNTIKLIATILILLLLLSCHSAKTDDEMKLAVFNETWELINQNYYLQDFGGLDWQAVKKEYEPQINEAQWPNEVYSLLIEMVDRLDDGGHSLFLPRPVIDALNLTGSSTNIGGAGITINRTDKGFEIVKTIPEGSAEDAGIPEGSIILAIDGTDISKFTHALELRAQLTGKVNTEIEIKYQFPGGSVEQKLVKLKDIGLFSNPVSIDQLPGTAIAYMEIWNFMDDSLPERIQEHMEADDPAQGHPSGIIIDLRRNMGGMINTMMKTTAIFLPANTYLGQFTGKKSRTELKVPENPVLTLQNLPLAILVSPNTKSAAEIFAMALRENTNCIVIGQRTEGNVEQTEFAELPDGSRLYISVAGYQTGKHFQIEGNGITPDEVIEVSVDSWTKTPETDPHIQAAVKWLISRDNTP